MGKKTKFLIRIVVSLGLLVFLFSQLDWTQARALLGQASLVYLPWPIMVLMADRIWMAWKWRMLLQAIAPAPSLFDAVRVYYVSSFLGLALPLGGLGPDLVRYTYLRSSNISGRAVAASILLERMIGLLATLTVTLGSATLLVGQVRDDLVGTLLGVGGVGLAAALAIALPLFHAGIQRLLYRHLTGTRLFARSRRLQQLADTLKKYRGRHKVLLANYGLSVVEQLFPVMTFYLAFQMFQVPVTMLECLSVVPISIFLQRLPISYAGIGIREGSMVLLFGALGAGYADILIVSTSVFFLLLLSLLPGAIWSFGNNRIQAAEAPAE